MKCPKCQTENTDTARFCNSCATPLTAAEDARPSFTKTLETPVENLSRGTLFADRYEIIEELGKGGMGRVYRVYDTKVKGEVALKLINPEVAADRNTIERFRNELKLARDISHKNVCRMYDFHEEKGAHFITMEYVRGQDLKGLSRQTGKLTIETSISISKQICEGLSQAHSLGIVHRDLKPSNIMIDKDGNVHLMDFGIARSLKTKGITGSGVIIGTPEYMSPEQAEAKDIDLRSDIYSFGVILYEMLTGMLPFDGDTPLSIALKHKSELFVAPINLNPTIPQRLNSLILKCLEKSKAQRYQDSSEILNELLEIETTIPSIEKEKSKRIPLTSKEITLKLKFKRVIVIAVVLISLIFICTYFILRSSRGHSTFEIGATKQLSYEPGLELDPSVSPDGKMVAFATGALGEMRLVVRQASGGQTIEVTKNFTNNQRWPKWSPDGNHIAFYSNGSIYMIPALGDVPKKIIENEQGYSVYSPTWSPNCEMLAYVADDSIFAYTINTGLSEKLCDAKEAHCLSWSPDGTKISYVSGNLNFIYSQIDIPEALYPVIGNIAPSSIHILRLSDSESIKVTDNAVLNTCPVWSADSSHLLFISNRGGARDIYSLRIEASGKPIGLPERMTTGLNPHTISLSRDGKKLAYSVFNYTGNVWAIEIPEDEPISVTRAQRITMGNQIVESMDISHDGEWLAYDSNLNGNMDIYKMPIQGGGEIQLTTDPSDDFIPCWSPDGEHIAFHSFRSGNRDIFCIDKDGGSLQALTDEKSHERSPDWSPDGQKVTYFSDYSGRNEVWIVAKENMVWGEPAQVTFDDGLFPKWSPTGNIIAYISNDALKLISLDNNEIIVLVPAQENIDFPKPKYPSWSLDGKSVYYLAMDGKGNISVWGVAATGGDPELKIIFDDPYNRIGLPNFSTGEDLFYFCMRVNESNIWIMDLSLEK
ncbi:protein kinase [Acidobacteriota bacterium]